MKQLQLRLPDGTPAPATDFGSVPPGTSTPTRELRLVNTGDEPITNVEALVVNDSLADGEYRVSLNGVALTGEWQPVLAEALAPGAFLTVQESWTTPVGVTTTGADHGQLRVRYAQ
ncbi:hypothetical protein [Deinococcus sp. UR1]|uniref:hypothetical protein n=1 Tax=Deinococcus sp. UR1 TaxID=1704277 RepID=UPI0006DC9C06|nr:hypothetical protein [Deinococcus sp. UR1]PIH00270.1 hypothetical protein AMD26_001500 [Deinococcus sp. UR1]